MNILVPVDGSPASLRAVDFAVKMASQTPGTSLVLLNVQNISAMALAGAAMAGDLQEAASQAAASALGGAVEKSEAAGAVFKTLHQGDPPGGRPDHIGQVAVRILKTEVRLIESLRAISKGPMPLEPPRPPRAQPCRPTCRGRKQACKG